MKPVVFHPDAYQDLLDAAIYYDQKQPGLGDRFSAIVEIAAQQIQTFPSLGNPSSKYKKGAPQTVSLPDCI